MIYDAMQTGFNPGQLDAVAQQIISQVGGSVSKHKICQRNKGLINKPKEWGSILSNIQIEQGPRLSACREEVVYVTKGHDRSINYR